MSLIRYWGSKVIVQSWMNSVDLGSVIFNLIFNNSSYPFFAGVTDHSSALVPGLILINVYH